MAEGKQEQIGEIFRKLSRLAGDLDERDKSVQCWLAENFPHPELDLHAKDLTVLTLRVLNAIAQAQPLNGIAISRRTGIPKGSVSKIAWRLVRKKLVVREGVPGNKKEVQFRITSLGEALVAANHAFDQRMETQGTALMKSYSLEELSFLNRVLDDVALLFER